MGTSTHTRTTARTRGAGERPRPYLRAEARRRHLLDAAARLFVREGYAGMTMVALAAEAGVSRRLVYDHFPDLAALYGAFFDDRASRYLASIDRAVTEAGGDAVASFAGAFRHLLAVPADDQRAIRLVVADPGLPELERVRTSFRARVENRWLPFFGEQVDRDLARALLWTLASGLLGLADLVGRGEITSDAAVTLASALVAELPSTIAAATHAPGPERTRAGPAAGAGPTRPDRRQE
jgi:AcrR family transcriptional regulator